MNWRINRDAYARRLDSLHSGEATVKEISSGKLRENDEPDKAVVNS